MYKNKIPDKEKIKLDNFYFHNPPDKETLDKQIDILKECQELVFTSIDPGVSNYGIRIEKRLKSGKVEPLYFKRIDLSKYSNCYSSLNSYFEEIDKFLSQTHIFIIEHQLPFKTASNRILQHSITYLTLKYCYQNNILFCEINPKMKTKLLNCPSEYNEGAIKKWCVDKAKEICQKRFDLESITCIDNERKKDQRKKPDDLADTICQIEVFNINYDLITNFPVPATIYKIPNRNK